MFKNIPYPQVPTLEQSLQIEIFCQEMKTYPTSKIIETILENHKLYHQNLMQIEDKHAVSYEKQFSLIALEKILPSCSQELLIAMAKDALWYQTTSANMLKIQQETYEKNATI